MVLLVYKLGDKEFNKSDKKEKKETILIVFCNKKLLLLPT